MEIDLTPDQEALITQGVRSGRFSRPEDAAKEALNLWEDRERKRIALRSALDEASDSAGRGEGRVVATEEDRMALVDDTHRRGLARLAGSKPA